MLTPQVARLRPLQFRDQALSSTKAAPKALRRVYKEPDADPSRGFKYEPKYDASDQPEAEAGLEGYEDSHRKVALGISPIDRVGAGVEVGCDVVELASAAVKPRYREERKDDQEGDYKPHR